MQYFTIPSELTKSSKSASNPLMFLCCVEISFLEQNPENEILSLNGVSGDINFDYHSSASSITFMSPVDVEVAFVVEGRGFPSLVGSIIV